MFGNKFIWLIWGLITVGLASYYFYQFETAEDKSALLIGKTSHGHFQIELACSSCHTDAFGGPEILQNACVNCHGAELEKADDSHPKSKFTDPRNADRVEILDARFCITCHTEHQQESTLTMGLTLPKDYCFHCHQNIFEDRPSHEGMEFETCATSGCHNYHDNRALYEDFLIEHGNEPELLLAAHFPIRQSTAEDKPLSIEQADAPTNKVEPSTLNDWHMSEHAQKGVQCSDCHSNKVTAWIDKPSISECKGCHANEVKGFTSGKHGMRLAADLDMDLTPVTPATASSSLTFNSDSNNVAHGCNTCHNSHQFNTREAATTACLNCHADEHSLAYETSPHGQLWAKELAGDAALGSGVSCATCHLPRVTHEEFGKKIVRVEHNQNDNLRPNEKMIRSVCMNCHGLGFAIDALADEKLIRNNFTGKPNAHIPSIDMALKRIQPVQPSRQPQQSLQSSQQQQQ